MTESQGPPDTEAEVIAIVRLYRDLGESISQLQEQRRALRDRFDALVPRNQFVMVDGKAAYRAALQSVMS